MATAITHNTQTAQKRRAASTSPLYRLAWRNVWRQKRRTTLLVIVVAYATASIIFFWGFTDGYAGSIVNNQARLFSAPAMVMTADYFSDPDPENALTSLPLEAIQNVSGVQDMTLRLEFPALLRSPYTSMGASVRGIQPDSEGRLSTVPGYVSDGRMIENTGEVVMGIELARELDVRLGERLAVDVSSTAGPQGAGLILVGMIDAGIVAVDESSVLVHIDDARSLTGVDTATGIALDVPRGQEEEVAARVQEVLPAGMRAYDVMELLGPLRLEVEGSRIQMIPVGLLFAIFAALAVTSTVLVSVIERAKEFGMMAAIGFAPPRLARMVVIEAALATFVGWLVGVVIGYALNMTLATFNILGPAFESAFESFAEFGFSDELYTTVSPMHAVYAAVTVVFAGIFALLIPARKVATLNPVDAMRAD